MAQEPSHADDAPAVEQEVASLIEESVRDPQTFDSTLSTLRDKERLHRLTSDTTNAPICARAIIQLYLAHGRVSEAIQELSVLMKRRAQMSESVQGCVDELALYLHSHYNSETKEVAQELIPLLEPLISHIAGLIVVEGVYVSLSIWCMLCYRRVGQTAKAVHIAETLNADTAGSLAYADRMDFATQQLEVALWAGEHIKCLVLGPRIREKTLREVYEGHHTKWLEALQGVGPAAETDSAGGSTRDLDHPDRPSQPVPDSRPGDEAVEDVGGLGETKIPPVSGPQRLSLAREEELYAPVERLRDIRRRYYAVMADAYFLDKEWASYSRCAWEQARTYLEEVQDVQARGDEVTPEDWEPQLFELATVMSSAAVAAFIALKGGSSSAVLQGLADSAVFAENPAYVKRHLRPLCAAIHPLSKVLVHSFRTHSEAFDSDWESVQATYGPHSADNASCLRYSNGEDGTPVLGRLRMFTEPGTDVARIWGALTRAYLMYYLRTCTTMYSCVQLSELAKLIKCTEDELEEALVSMENVYMKIDRPGGVVSFQKPETARERTEKWGQRVHMAVRRLIECGYLINGTC